MKARPKKVVIRTKRPKPTSWFLTLIKRQVSKATAFTKAFWPFGMTKTFRFLTVFDKGVAEIPKRRTEAVAKEFSKYVKDIIRGQRYRWHPLSDKWLAYKRQKGLDGRIHIATHSYVNSIRAAKIHIDGRDVAWRVGVPNTVHPPSGLSYRQLARILEFGRTREGGRVGADWLIPPRPHWRPAWSAFKRNMDRDLVKRTKKEILRFVRKMVKK